MENYFSLEKTKQTLGEFKRKLKNFAFNENKSFVSNQKYQMLRVVDSMLSMPKEWDQRCQINIGWVGEFFLDKLSRPEVLESKESVDEAYCLCFKFLYEMHLSRTEPLSVEFQEVIDFTFKELAQFDEQARKDISYITISMPTAIFKQVANSSAISDVREFNKAANNAKDLRSEWEKEIKEKENRVENLKKSLDKYEIAFNFVGLFKGFNDLSVEKNKERQKIFFGLIFLSIMVLAPVCFELYFVYKNIHDIAAIKDGMLVSIAPTIALVAIITYYFRVLLFNYNSVKAQILQIELRKTLCTFIHGYTEFSEGAKKRDANSLERFEAIIFSPILTDSKDLPSTYDGIEQIGKLVKSLKT